MALDSNIFDRFGQSSWFFQELYEQYCRDPKAVGPTWADFFARLEGKTPTYTNGHGANGYSPASAVDASLQDRVHRLVSAHRERGHFHAKINPLTKGVLSLPLVEDLVPDYYQFTSAELDRVVPCAGFRGQESARLSSLIENLQATYCGSIGIEFTHLVNLNERTWLQELFEHRLDKREQPTVEQAKRMLAKIVEAETFENELHRKYVGHKRFSLEGGEAVIPMLDVLFDRAAQNGVKETVLGMAHRGRLNVLVNSIGKPLEDVFNEFEDQNVFTSLGSGDVKYHMGFSGEYRGPSGAGMMLHLAPNPSHLEFVNPVVEGIARAKQDVTYHGNRQAVLPLLIHGDAAVVGQGVVPETFNLANTRGFGTGGTVHLVINNQIGFTTDPDDSRSSVYCTDMAKAVQAPIFHVNGEDIEACCWTMRAAIDYRNRFGRDVVVDLYCWRKYGHNEGDDPSFTQPVTYAEIKEKPHISKTYGASLVAGGLIPEGYAEEVAAAFKQRFAAAHQKSTERTIGDACATHGKFRGLKIDTGVDRETLERLAKSLVSYPHGFTPHPKLGRLLEKRAQTVFDGEGIEWGLAEGLAFGSLLSEGKPVRLSGQDCGRGTFSQRHVELVDYKTSQSFFPLSAVAAEYGTSFITINSTLSEAACLGFEFGYATFSTEGITLWEGQFGDFANGAQVAIDQFIASSEQKWNQLSGVVLLLPHGYEGQGPEHSSARLERYLQLSADLNWSVCYPTNAAQYFHLLRRQGHVAPKRPLVVMTPKSLLRFAPAMCRTEDLTKGRFHSVLVDTVGAKPQAAVFLSGKVYYDVLEALKTANVENSTIAAQIIRLEELYPLPAESIQKALKGMSPKKLFWVQEEPKNMGAWSYCLGHFKDELGLDLQYIGRPESASTATGSGKRHAKEQKEIVEFLLRALI